VRGITYISNRECHLRILDWVEEESEEEDSDGSARSAMGLEYD